MENALLRQLLVNDLGIDITKNANPLVALSWGIEKKICIEIHGKSFIENDNFKGKIEYRITVNLNDCLEYTPESVAKALKGITESRFKTTEEIKLF